MKNRIRNFLVGTAVIAVLLLAAGDGLAKRDKGNPNAILFSGEMNANWNVIADAGEYTCPSGEASGLPYGPGPGRTLAPCSAGSNFHMRDREMVFDFVNLVPPEASPLVEGQVTLLVNWNWQFESALTDSNYLYSGPMWATFELVLADGTTWEGTATGYWDGENSAATWSMVGHGNGGDIDGMQIKAEFVGDAWGGQIQGRILSPGSAKK
jgi:hypothetical protein